MPQFDQNIAPYFNSFDEAKKYYHILHRPRVAVQTRELNEVQSIFYNQLKRLSDHIFEEGAIVKDGEIKVDNTYRYIKVVAPNLSQLDVSDDFRKGFLNKILRGENGVKALVVNYLQPSAGQVTFFVKYVGSNTTGDDTGTVRVFEDGEELTLLNDEGSTSGTVVTLVSSNATGVGSAANIKSGILYARGKYILFDQQTLVLDAYSNTPSYRVGFLITETVVTSDDDTSLADNASGFPNANAPGAHRLKVELTLTKLALNTKGDEDYVSDFIELLEVENGFLTKNKTLITDYSELEKTFARRTYDESGNYTVVPFNVDVREFYDSGTNRGIYTPDKFEYDTQEEAKTVSIERFGVSAPGTAHQVGSQWRPGSTNTNLIELMKAKLAIGIDPGKAYVEGFEIQTLAREYVDIKKARAFENVNNGTINTSMGNYVRVKNVYGLPDIKNYTKVKLYDRFTSSRGAAASGATEIGTARVRAIRYETGTVGDTAVYRAYLFDIQMVDGKKFENVRQLYCDLADTDFSCDIVPSFDELKGTISIDFSTDPEVVTGKGTGWQTVDEQLLVAGDYIFFLADDGSPVLSRVQTTPTSNNSLTLTTGLGAPSDVTDQAFYYAFTELFEPQDATAIFSMPYQFIRTLTADGITVDTNYNVQRFFSETADGTAPGVGSITIDTNHVDEVFQSYSADNWIITANGNLVPSGSITVTLQNSGTRALVQLAGKAEMFIRVATKVRKAQGVPATAKTKAISTGSKTVSDVGGINEISLGKADIIKVTAIYMSPNFSTAATNGHQNITEWYDLDNGQRDDFYDIGKIVRKKDYPVPTGRLLIEFQYFTHGVNGNYFSVDSYTVISGLEYEQIPVYESKSLGWKFNLRDCLDFRPRIKDDGSGFANTDGGSLTEFPSDGQVFADYQYYLNRIDKLYLDRRGAWRIVEGINGLNPPTPENPSSGMVTHQLNVRSYTLSPKDVIVDFKENKRYTMRDIGSLEKRIENLEYYTSLSLLESETSTLTIPDATNPELNRFKNGFIVDNFRGSGVGDTGSGEFKVAIDSKDGLMRPMYWSENTNLIEQSTTAEQRVLDHYAKVGDLFMLPYDEVNVISQLIASDRKNVNPFNVVVFIGDVKLDPASDEWKDTERAPDIKIDQEGNFSAIEKTLNGIGTVWGEWETNWAGVTKNTEDPVRKVIGNEVASVPMPHLDEKNQALFNDFMTGKRKKNKAWMSRPGVDPWPHREIIETRTTTVTSTPQTRQGVRGVATPSITKTELGDKVVKVAYIPYIRSREGGVKFRATGMMPNTQLFPFFDGVDVSAYCTAWSNPLVPEAFDANNTVANGDKLITDATGKVSGTFNIPNTETLRFQTGERMFKLSSNTDGTQKNADSYGHAFYRAQGLLETVAKEVLHTRNAEVSWEAVEPDQRILKDKDVSVGIEFGPWVDPIAENFKIEDEGGCFITSVEVYFQSKDTSIPVTVEIRNTVNGYPGPLVMPFGRVVKDAADVNVVANPTSMAQILAAPTKFTFESPIYLKQGGEYSLVILANTQKYHVWIATKGQNMIGTELPIMDQAYPGTFFGSENASTWVPIVESDLMFKVNKARFDTSTIGTIIFTNDVIPTVSLDNDPIITKKDASKIRIMHHNHGFRSDGGKQSRVTISGAVDTNGILATNINKTHTILSCDFDSYVVDTGDTAGSTGRGGGGSIRATENRQMDSVMPVVQTVVLPETSINFSLKATSSQSIHPDSSGGLYVIDSAYTPVVANETYHYRTPKMIASQDNETQHLAGKKSAYLKAILSSSNPNISPIIDLQRCSLTTIGNRIDNPSYDGTNDINDPDLDYTTLTGSSTNGNFVFNTNGTITSSNAATSAALSQIVKGKYIQVSGTSSNNGKYRVTNVVYSSGASTVTVTCDATFVSETPATGTIKLIERYVDERSPTGGSLSSKYPTKRMLLAQPSVGLRIMYAACRPASTELIVYYKTSRAEDQTPFDELPWEIATVDVPVDPSTNDNDFKEYTFTINDLAPFNAVATKIGYRGSNTCIVPRCRDFRMIALGT